MDKIEALEKVAEYKKLVKKHFDIKKMYLYGSFARDTNHNDSDIDVAIILDKIEGDYFSVNPLLWKLRREIDDRIEPFLIEKDFDEAGFIGEIEKYGILI